MTSVQRRTHPHGSSPESGSSGPRVGGSIADRLSSLQKSGEVEWRKRVNKKQTTVSSRVSSVIATANSTGSVQGVASSLQAAPSDSSSTELSPGSAAMSRRGLSDRLSKLENSQTSWRKKVQEKDTAQFTVEGKLKSSGLRRNESFNSALCGKKRISPRSQSFRTAKEKQPGTPTGPPRPVKHTQSFGSPSSRPQLPGVASRPDPTEQVTTHEVLVPTMDEQALHRFFGNKEIGEEAVDCSIDDFNDIFLESEDILPSTRRAKASVRGPTTRRKRTAGNPLRALKDRGTNSYIELDEESKEVQMRKLRRNLITGNVSKAEEALAGLAAKENFSSVSLRCSKQHELDQISTNKYRPYQDLMLLHVKGRRYCQVRLVEPCAKSLNSGDSYILITRTKIFCWLGAYSNVIEKAKAKDVANYIWDQKDMGCKLASSVHMIEETRQDSGYGSEFWKLLGGRAEYPGCGPAEEDELYETYMNEAQMTYYLHEGKLQPYPDFCAVAPSYLWLDPRMIYVFDFGSEMYIWFGVKADMISRKQATDQATELWERGYDYTDCNINPICPLYSSEEGGLPMKDNNRPEWCMIAKVNHNMETVLFKEKFSDWPDATRIIRGDAEETKKQSQFGLSVGGVGSGICACDVGDMVEPNTKPVSLELEGSQVGRGRQWIEECDGLRWEFDIRTVRVTVWHVNEYEHELLSSSSHSQFHDAETYVVRWNYMIERKGIRQNKTVANLRPQRGSVQVGRERCAYFFWQGGNSAVNDKGASALMTVELDEEAGPQIQVTDGDEPACFLNLFNGEMTVHSGPRAECKSPEVEGWCMYQLRHEEDNELCLRQISVEARHLRSRACYLIIDRLNAVVYVWLGCKAPQATNDACRSRAEQWVQSVPMELRLPPSSELQLQLVEEGCESTRLKKALNLRGERNEIYHCMLDETKSQEHSPRLFQLSSLYGKFESTEQLAPTRHRERTTPFLFHQNQLYAASQPALFILDNTHEVYLWQGLKPEATEEESNVETGSLTARWAAERKAALNTCLDYAKAKNRDSPPTCYLVTQGVEPLHFRNLFPHWKVDDRLHSLALSSGRKDGEQLLVVDELSRLTCSTYTLAQLTADELPDGVDPMKLESYLCNDEFNEIMGMNKTEFYALPGWKQNQLKKGTPLF